MLFPVAERVANIVLFRNIPFNNKYEHHPFISNKFTYKGATKHSGGSMYSFLYAKKSNNEYYFDRLVLDTGFNFNYGNGLVTSVVLEVPHQFTDANYMSVIPIGTTRPYYFFITNVVISTASYTDNTSKITCTMTLELDVLATYQNDILDGFTGNVRTERKHCQRYAIDNNVNLTPYCIDFSLSEPALSNCKPNIVKDIKNFTLLDGTSSDVGYRTCSWFYVSFRGEFGDYVIGRNQSINDIKTPFKTVAFPNVPYLRLVDRNGTYAGRIIKLEDFLKQCYDNPNVISIKTLPYPPFPSLTGNNPAVYQHRFTISYDATLNSNVAEFIIDNDAITYVQIPTQPDNPPLIGLEFNSGNNKAGCWIKYNASTPSAMGFYMLETNDNTHEYSPVEMFTTATKPLTLIGRDVKYEPRLLFNPFKKYLLKSQYASGEELHPELVGCETPLSNYMVVESCLTAYAGDLTISTYPTFISAVSGISNLSEYYRKINKGLISSPNYSYPVGEDALKSFSQTQGSSYTTQTIGRVISGALAIAGGVASIAGGFSAPVGAVAITGGIATVGTAIGGAVAKYSDLTNTPDTINTLGGSIFHDLAVGNTLHPYLCCYELTTSEQEMIYDYFYEYGYVVNRCCIFNKELYPSDYSNNKWVDTRLFTRTNFNYIKINENISGKLYGDIPPIVKDKINNILNNGVRLYTLFDTNFANPITNLQDLYEGNVYENMEVALTLN